LAHAQSIRLPHYQPARATLTAVPPTCQASFIEGSSPLHVRCTRRRLPKTIFLIAIVDFASDQRF
jgi:hypothetical protein